MKKEWYGKTMIGIGLAVTLLIGTAFSSYAESLTESCAYLAEEGTGTNGEGSGDAAGGTSGESNRPLIGGEGETGTNNNQDQPSVDYVPSGAENISGNKTIKTGSSTSRTAVPRVRLSVSGTLYMAPKKSQKLTASGLISSDRIVSWNTSNAKAVKVSSTGLLTAKKAGRARITVRTQKGAQASVLVVVRKASVKADRSRVTLCPKQRYSLHFSGLVSGDYISSCRSSNKKVATVTRNGVIRGKKKGTAKITIKTKYGAKTVVKVRVRKEA